MPNRETAVSVGVGTSVLLLSFLGAEIKHGFSPMDAHEEQIAACTDSLPSVARLAPTTPQHCAGLLDAYLDRNTDTAVYLPSSNQFAYDNVIDSGYNAAQTYIYARDSLIVGALAGVAMRALIFSFTFDKTPAQPKPEPIPSKNPPSTEQTNTKRSRRKQTMAGDDMIDDPKYNEQIDRTMEELRRHNPPEATS